MASITVKPVSYVEDAELWDQLLESDPLQHPFGYPLDQEYSRAYAPTVSFIDKSMVALAGGQPVAGLQITSHGLPNCKVVDFYGRPALLRRSGTTDTATRKSAEMALAKAFMDLYGSLDSPSLEFLEIPDKGRLSDFAECLLDEGFCGRPVYKQVIDLTKEEEELRRAVRQSNKPHINWGDKNLSIITYDQSNVTPESIEQFRRLHIAVAGKETRSSQSWDLQYRQIMENQAFMITGSLGSQLVTAALFIHSPKYCYYGVSASIREMFDKPLSHAILWRSVLVAKRRGCRNYEMGDLVDLYAQGYSEKERNIADFKRSFGGKAHVYLRIGNSVPQ